MRQPQGGEIFTAEIYRQPHLLYNTDITVPVTSKITL